MLKITTENQKGAIHMMVEGRLVNGWIDELERCWRESAAHSKEIHVDFINIPYIEPEAKVLLATMAAEGVILSAREIHMKAILTEILRERL